MSSTATATTTARLEWLKERQKGIGGSDAAAACGLCKWTTRYKLYHDKTDPVQDEKPTEAQYWGSKNESNIRERYIEETGFDVWVPPKHIEHPVHSFARCNLDGVANGDRILQVKTARSTDEWGSPGTDEIPEQYMIQIQHELGCAQLDLADVPVLFYGAQFEIYQVRADPSLQAEIFSAEAEFWDMVVNRIEPEPESEDDLRHKWGRVFRPGQFVDANAEAIRFADELAELKDRIATDEKRKEAIEIELKKMIQDREGILVNGKPLCTWKETASKRFDVSTFAKDHPDQYAAYTKETTSRRFLLKKVK